MRAGLHLVLAVAILGCGTSPAARFYTLDATARPDGSRAGSYAIVVGPVTVPPAVDRPQLVLQAAPNRVTVDEFHRWAGPLDDAVARAIAGNLAALLGTTQVAALPATGLAATHRVTVDLQRFEATPGGGVVVEALWAVRPWAGGEGTSGRTLATEALEGAEVDAVPAAYSRALATVSADVAAAIRSDAGRRRVAAPRSR